VVLKPKIMGFFTLFSLILCIYFRGNNLMGLFLNSIFNHLACLKCGRHHERNQNSADNHRLAYKESLEDKTNKELKNKVSLTILDKECPQGESPSL
jgi:hypothetical protein